MRRERRGHVGPCAREERRVADVDHAVAQHGLTVAGLKRQTVTVDLDGVDAAVVERPAGDADGALHTGGVLRGRIHLTESRSR